MKGSKVSKLVHRDPLADPEPLIRSVYAYVAARVGPGAEAQEITSVTFERALRYRAGYDRARGEPIAWLIGIARRCVLDAVAEAGAENRADVGAHEWDSAVRPDPEHGTVERISLLSALAALDERDRELLVLRYWADLTARQIAKMNGTSTNAVEVALHRARGRLRRTLREQEGTAEGGFVRVH